ncbi:hypothetical protein Tco_0506181 [Tanacetum coccineum]
MFEKKVNTTPVDYATLNQLYKDFETRFVPQTELSAEQAFWSQNLMNSLEPILSSRPTIVEVPKELPKVSMNTASDLEMLKIDVEPITPKLLNKQTAHSAYIKHTQKEATVLRDLVEHVKSKYPLNQSLESACRVRKSARIPKVFCYGHSLCRNATTLRCRPIPRLLVIEPVLGLASIFPKAQQLEPKLYVGDIIEKTNPIVIPDSEETLLLAEKSRSKMLLRQKDPIMLEKKVNTTPVDYAALNQLYKDFETRFVPQTELSAEQAFWSQNSVNSPEPILSSRPTIVEVPKELPKVSMVNTSLKKLKHHLAGFDVVVKERTTPTAITEAQSQEKDTVIKKLKERINALSRKKNEDKIKQELEEIQTINIELDHREKVLVITTLKDDLRKLKEKAPVDNDITKHPSDPEMLKIDVEPITPKLLNKQTAQYAKLVQELLTNISKTCPSINNADGKLVAVTPKNKDKSVRFTEPVTSSGYTITKIAYTSNIVSNKPMLSSTGVKPSTSASGSQPSGNTKKDKIRQTPSSTQKNKVEAHPRKVKSSLKNKDCVVESKGTAHVQHSRLNANSKLKCVKCNGCMLSANHDLCVLDFINNVNAHNKSKSVKKNSKRKVWKPTGKVFTNIGYIWRPTGQTFTIVGNACPLTRITTTTEVPLRKPLDQENETPKPVVTLVYSRKPRKSKTNVPISNSKVVQTVLWYLDSGCSKHMTGDRSQLTNSVNKFLGTVKFENDHVAKILGYGDYQTGNVTLSRVYYVEGLGHNSFSIGQFCDSNLEVAFRQHTCFIHNLEGVDLLTGSRVLAMAPTFVSSELWCNQPFS